MRVQNGGVLGEVPLPGLQIVLSLLCSHSAERELAFWPLLIRDLIHSWGLYPHDLIIPQKPHLQIEDYDFTI